MAKYTVTTLGCRVNHCESEAIASELTMLGWDQSGAGEPADVALVNTCCVTQKAAMQSRQAIRRILRTHPAARVVVTGCYAQTEPAALRRIAGIDRLIGQADKHRIARILVDGGDAVDPPPPVATQSVFRPFAQPALGNRARPLLKIQDGCNSFCTYCIVPHARGPSRSLDPDLVVKTIHRIAAAGYHEVVLTGIHMGAYGLDLHPRVRLYDLLLRLAEARPIHRIRLSSIEPHELCPQIVELVARCPLFCRHFHIPMQSADNGILKAMGRPYTADQAAATIAAIADLIPDAAVGADLLVGFPGESPAAFSQTLDHVSRLPLTYLHVFPFSPRDKTPAGRLGDRVPQGEMAARCRMLRDLGMRKKMAFWRSQIGKSVGVITENQTDGGTRAISDNYVPVLLQPGLAPDTMITATLATSGSDAYLFGVCR